MKVQLELLLVFFSSVLITDHWCQWSPNIDTITMNTGDRIWCRTYPLDPIWHNLMASGPNSFIQVNGSITVSETVVVEVTRQQFIDAGGEKYCENEGLGPLGRNDSLKLARQWVGKKVYYNSLMCNDQHWVNYWTYGFAGLSYNSGLPINSECNIPVALSNSTIQRILHQIGKTFA